MMPSDSWWMILVKTVAIFLFLTFMTIFVIVFERKVVARVTASSPAARSVVFAGFVALLVLILLARPRRLPAHRAVPAPPSGGFPTPPLDLAVPTPSRASAVPAERLRDAVEEPP
ncbi:hypothetical protein ACIA5D_45360 [Actinoplanes sp. NPDC051513]|uniref:hypothetical protein n=1 Tax=Actinoplanes sp. NPDC051513 TaxID=3363908 RepID=UPI0037B181EA